MRLAGRVARLQRQRVFCSASCRAASTQPPVARPYKPTTRSPSPPVDPEAPEAEAQEKPDLLFYLWPFGKRRKIVERKSEPQEPKSLQRGVEAAKQYVRTGRLDERYHDAAFRWTLLICAAPIAIVTTYHLYMRGFGYAEQKVPQVKTASEQHAP